MRKLTFLVGVGAGYVLGARAGRDRYEQIATAFDGFRTNPKVTSTTDKVTHQATDLASTAKDKVVTKIDEHRHADETETVPVDVSTANVNGRTSSGTVGL